MCGQRMDKNAITQKIKEHPFGDHDGHGPKQKLRRRPPSKTYGKLLAIDTNMKSGKIRMTAGDNTELRLALES